jgi:hypothetical protein
MDIQTIIDYEINKIEFNVKKQLEQSKSALNEPMDFLIIKYLLDNYSKNADGFDSLNLINKVLDYCLKLTNPHD